MKFKDYYAILGVERTANEERIKTAYRRLARKYHPDVSEQPDTADRFKEVREAYEVLKDPKARASYDRLGSRWRAGDEFRPPPNWGGARGPRRSDYGYSDFFETLFGEAAQGAGAARTAAPESRERFRLEITLEEGFQGGERTVQLPTGVGPRGRSVRSIRVKIPAGVAPGQSIRLAGQGSRPGVDLYLELAFLPHPVFTISGTNICLELPVTPWEAALGAQVKVPTLGKMVTLSLPAGVDSGRRLRLRGRGLGAETPGDLVVTVRIVVPVATTQKQRELYAQLRDEYSFDPRASLYDFPRDT